jgi:cytochrome c peroxidase
MFVEAFDHVDTADEVTIVEVARALGAFIGTEWRNFDSPYDAWLAGDRNALTPEQERGRQLFFGRANCASCHSGALLSDQSFHALALPPLGPGRTRRFDPVVRDVGRMGESDALEDAYRFRTPMLRNVALTAPYGHNGTMPTLAAMIRHHADPVASWDAWTPDMAPLPAAGAIEVIDRVVWQDARELARQRARIDITPVALSDTDVAEIEAFLHALTGATALSRPLGVPDTVPSGLPVDHGRGG